MSTLILVEHDNHSVHPVTFSTLNAAKQFAGPIILVVIGHNCQSVVQQAVLLEGVSRVIAVDDPVCLHFLAETLSSVLVQLAPSFQVILAPATTFGKNILPRVAAKLDVAQISDVIKIIDQDIFEHPIYAGNAIQRVQSLDSIKLLTIRTTAFDARVGTQAACPIEKIDIKPIASNTQFVSHQLNQSTRPELGSAKIIVSGGRGLQNAEKFKLIDELADVLGGAVGASRAAVDAGFVPNDYQVGQTGKVVAPDLYIAIGISGAIQHLAGMKDSKVIVAINKDEDAPIFQIATDGLVADLFEVVPELTRILKS